jgi:hypothetical protein
VGEKSKKAEQPPQPPDVAHRLQFYPWQLIGVGLIMLVPVLALLGVFGESRGATHASGAGLEVRVEYLTRLRYKMLNPMTVSVQNMSTQSIPTLTVAVDRAYIEGFSDVTFTPDADEITGSDYVVELIGVPPGETRVVTVSLEARRYGRFTGRVRAAAGDGAPAEARVETFVFP